MVVQIQQTLIRRRQIEIESGPSRTTIHRRMREKMFPRAARIGARSLAWRCADIDAWLVDPAGYRVEG
ncbi:AlpA family transcriptional regulator [Paraburkholderia sp.]|uniref:helix-turn-helix transcriptional regulator n=1 Tax=Paraburkholderia sp. TaxID=1926495 RepID=UPI0025CB7792|nr:AlpA family phage regulatory protein [Paraburkholderia sp.]